MAQSSPVGADSSATTVVVRPDGVCQSTCSFLHEHGIPAQALPVINVEPCWYPVALIKTALQGVDAIVATSANIMTVLHYHQGALPKMIPVCAVGEKTASALRPYFKTILLPETHNSEGMNELLEAHPEWKKLVILKGHGGRKAIQQRMSAQGRTVTTLTLYRRIPNNQIEHSTIHWQYVNNVVVTSVELVEQLMSRFPVTRFPHIRWIVLSERIANALRQFGMKNIIVTSGTDNLSIFKALSKNRILT
jgi:uroporphyrinogen-III synthase